MKSSGIEGWPGCPFPAASFLLTGLFVLAIATCGSLEARAEAGGEGEHGHHDSHGDDEDEHERETVTLADTELEEFGIKVETAGPGTIEIYVATPGEVQPNANGLAHIVPRYPGIVTDVRANIGDTVRKGQVLAIVESDESLALFELKTLVDGTVIDKHLTLGEAVSRASPTFVIADLSTVWIDLTIYQRDISRVKVGLKAEIFTGHHTHRASGTISYVTPIVDERTRTATARIVVPNPDGDWRPGMFVTARILIDRVTGPVVIPRTALHTMDEQTVVFVESERGFLPRTIEIGLTGETHVEVRAGLEVDERYVSEGGLTLKAEFGKEAFGDGHGH